MGFGLIVWKYIKGRRAVNAGVGNFTWGKREELVVSHLLSKRRKTDWQNGGRKILVNSS